MQRQSLPALLAMTVVAYLLEKTEGVRCGSLFWRILIEIKKKKKKKMACTPVSLRSLGPPFIFTCTGQNNWIFFQLSFATHQDPPSPPLPFSLLLPLIIVVWWTWQGIQTEYLLWIVVTGIWKEAGLRFSEVQRTQIVQVDGYFTRFSQRH